MIRIRTPRSVSHPRVGGGTRRINAAQEENLMLNRKQITKAVRVLVDLIYELEDCKNSPGFSATAFIDEFMTAERKISSGHLHDFSGGKLGDDDFQWLVNDIGFLARQGARRRHPRRKAAAVVMTFLDRIDGLMVMNAPFRTARRGAFKSFGIDDETLNTLNKPPYEAC